MCDNPIKANLKTHDGTQNRAQAGKRGLLLCIIIFTLWAVGIFFLLSLIACTPVDAKPIATEDISGYYIDLLKIESGKPSRYLLAFFVPIINMDAQSLLIYTDTALNAPKNATRAQSIISMANHLPADYDGKTSQNIIAFTVNMRGSFFRAKSDSCLTPFLIKGKAQTQKSKGGHYHA